MSIEACEGRVHGEVVAALEYTVAWSAKRAKVGVISGRAVHGGTASRRVVSMVTNRMGGWVGSIPPMICGAPQR